MQIEEICGNFINDKVMSVISVGGGHINDTHFVTTAAGRFICQRVKGTMDAGRLTHNYKLYSRAFDEAGMSYPKWIKTVKGDYFLPCENGDNWRMYPYIEGDILSAPVTLKLLHECGRGLAMMHRALESVTERFEAVYPQLHDLNYYYDEYKNTLSGINLVERNRNTEFERIIDTRIHDMLKATAQEEASVHGDAKLGNILFRDGKVLGFIDMDTVMQGLPIEDVADCIRSSCVIDGRLNKKSAQAVAEGYKSVMGDKYTQSDIRKAFNKICFELALRYYTDSISVKGHFKEHTPGYRFNKAQSLIKILRDE